MQSLKPHTALLVVCLLGQKLGDNVVSLSQLNAVSTLFLMGKLFIKPFFTKTQGCFLQYPCYLRSGAKSEASLALLACVLSPPLGRCLTQQSTSFFFWECGGGGPSSKWLFLFPVNSQSLFGEVGWKQVFAEYLAQIWPGKARPTRASFLIYTSLAGGLGDRSLNPK